MEIDRDVISIAGLSSLRGEREVPIEELAAAHETTHAAVLRSLGGARVYATERDRSELVLDAAQQALARSMLPASSLSVIMNLGSNGQRLQHELGAPSAFVLEGGYDCTALVAGMRTVFDHAHRDPEFRMGLIAIAECRVSNPKRSYAKIDERTTRDLFSDGASAVVLRRGGDRMVLLGFGVATEGANWDYWRAFSSGEVANLNDVQVIGDQLPVLREGLARCLRAAKLEREAIDHAIFPIEGHALPYTFARAIRIPKEKVYVPRDVATHMGASDAVLALESLLRSDLARPGQIVLVCSRTIGVAHFALVRL